MSATETKSSVVQNPKFGSTPALTVRGLSIYFNKNQVLKNVTIDIAARAVTAIIGPSGCGKSTFLRAINRMHELNPEARMEGEIRLFGDDIYSRGVQPVVVRRRVGMVFQKSNPFPTMSINENVTVGLRLNGVRDKKILAARTEESLRMAALWDEVKDRLHAPAISLSGGQQQRLCIARALAVQPEVLDLIRKQDIDIYDIPIASITAQFLAYVNQLRASDVDVAGDFIYTASLLIHIKSKMLLPRAETGPEEAAEDPRRELVERLLEHERFKNAAQMLQQKQMLEAATWSNPGAREFKDDESAEPEIAADTVDLVRIFRDILERARNRPVIDVEEDSVTVGQMIQFLARRLTMEDKPVALRRLLSHTHSRSGR